MFYIGFACSVAGWSSDWGWGLALGILETIAGIWLLFAAINAACESFIASAGSVGWTIVSVLFLILTIVFTVMFLSNPIAGGVVVWLWLGLSLICYGAFRMVLAFKLKTLGKVTDGML